MNESFNRTPQARAFSNARACGYNDRPKHLTDNRAEHKTESSESKTESS